MVSSEVLEKAYLNKSRILTKMGRTDEAMEYIDKTLELNPDNTSAKYEKGNILHRSGRSGKLLVVFTSNNRPKQQSQ